MEGENITILIEQELQKMAQFVPECSIHRVPERLLDMSCKAYVPKVISIGPLHRNQQNLRATEVLKLRFFNSYRHRIDEDTSVQGIVERVQSWDLERARQFYSEPINMNNEEFVRMLVLDGCFVVEFMIMNQPNLFPENENQVHASFYNAIELNIREDLIMLENQLPLFVLEGLFDLIQPNTTFIQVVHTFLMDRMFEITAVRPRNNERPQPHHLVDFLSSYFVRTENLNNVVHPRKFLPPKATQLSEANVVFTNIREEENETCTIMDISFQNGILNFPRSLFIDDKFETCARNLLAFAQFTGEQNVVVNDKGNVIHYFEFLDELISTEKDVSLLVKEGILMNCIGGSDKELSQMFNNIFKNINGHRTNCFSEIAEELNQHCNRRRNRYMASLKHDYLNTPWARISIGAATFLILLTLLQTIFTIISAFK